MTENNQKQLGKILWNIADDLRGSMNADDFRDYMLAFLFLRYLSDNYEAAAKKELGKDYPNPDAIENGGRTPLSVWYEQNPDAVVMFEKQMRRKAHYVIKPEHIQKSSSPISNGRWRSNGAPGGWRWTRSRPTTST
jgi:type I restriction enzyme M protein